MSGSLQQGRERPIITMIESATLTSGVLSAFSFCAPSSSSTRITRDPLTSHLKIPAAKVLHSSAACTLSDDLTISIFHAGMHCRHCTSARAQTRGQTIRFSAHSKYFCRASGRWLYSASLLRYIDTGCARLVFLTGMLFSSAISIALLFRPAVFLPR